MKFFKINLLPVLLFISATVFAQQTPAPEQTTPVTIVGATAHIGNGEVIKNSLIILEDGKIRTITDATSTKMPYRGTVIEAQGKHVYPGFIAPNSTLGLVEIDAVKQSDDEDELGEMLPHVRSIIAYNAESQVVESMRPNGVLIGQITPRGGRISGTSSIVQFDAWNWEDAVLKENDGLHINWPNTVRRGRWWQGEEPGIKPNDDYEKDLLKLSEFIRNAKAYLAGPRTDTNLPFEAMENVFAGNKRIYIHADAEKEIIDILAFKKEHDLKNVVLVGGYDAFKVADQLKENDIPVLVGRVHETPNLEDQDYDLPYKMAHLLNEKGLLVGLETSGGMERMNSRNLPFYAGTVVAFGADKEEALKMITSNTAKILGVDDQMGTLEVGKDATLFISEGDALDMRTNKLTKAYIQGRDISLESHQTELAKRYSEKFEKQEEK
ncbi:Imidazolonepropionase [Salinimicrobium catena]|uniref:Imidazolonepropionase n=1 Tax=Salinimicrobium catena TaxID=390640 RepID=A0A1H5MP27_9FLAO|nr:amidohydrolase family protein [Salinimicrobium catena]SDL26848.1 Imidazolonepropionase [Salinimicrobium catena]SEE90973.1 Imidazolonepropionase [Salinimicrobium catena]